MRFAVLVVLLACVGAPAVAQDGPGVIEGDIPFVTPDMTAFNATCRASDSLLNWMSSGKISPEDARDQICACLSDEFKLTFEQERVDILAKTLDGTITDAERSDPNFGPFADRAELLMRGCVGRVGL